MAILNSWIICIFLVLARIQSLDKLNYAVQRLIIMRIAVCVHL